MSAMPTPAPAAYITSAGVCALLKIDRSTLSRWVAAGKITPAVKAPGLRGAFLFDPAEVRRLSEQVAS